MQQSIPRRSRRRNAADPSPIDSSAVRRQMGVSLDSMDYDESWIVVDVKVEPVIVALLAVLFLSTYVPVVSLGLVHLFYGTG